MSDKVSPHKVLSELTDAMRSVMLSTVDEHGDPHCGYTPFIFDGRDIIVFVSQLSLHTRDLLSTGKVSVMLVEDESRSARIFARTRVSYQCKAQVIDNKQVCYGDLLDKYEQVHGSTVKVLRELPDFVLFRLQPFKGQFVMGFGQAYRLTGENLDSLEHATSG